MGNNFDIFSDKDFNDSDDDFELAATFDFTKVKKQTYEEKQALLEIGRIVEIRRLLQGNFKVGASIEDKLYSLVMNNVYSKSKASIQDTRIDKHGNTSLHYAVAPDCGGELKVDQIYSLGCSAVLETVISCNINPFILNFNGMSALSYISDLDLLSLVEERTRRFRKDVYCPIHFELTRKKIEEMNSGRC